MAFTYFSTEDSDSARDRPMRALPWPGQQMLHVAHPVLTSWSAEPTAVSTATSPPQRAADDGHPVGQPGQPETARRTRVEAGAVVPDLDGQLPVRPPQQDLNLVGLSVLDHVGECLGQHIPGGRLDVLWVTHAAQRGFMTEVAGPATGAEGLARAPVGRR
ncbi:hypothetical protein Ari01nite_16510 [Paractinoplanes rishiriensis]|uniref:Uncharacterized protein n=1 Tax=Paractinoplanes rishiriensis TaxID=1050105 RepID=A0A919JS68_9ACTN|nr:hypothetical protein Ari01nite_16510 [Actinoplanes rishiriensis]